MTATYICKNFNERLYKAALENWLMNFRLLILKIGGTYSPNHGKNDDSSSIVHK